MMGATSAPFWFSAFFLALMPTSIGYQDLAALLAQQPGVSQRWRDHLIASPFGTIEPATFSYGRPIGTSMPLGYQTVNFDPSAGAAQCDERRAGRISDRQPASEGRSTAGAQHDARGAGSIAATATDQCTAGSSAGATAAGRAVVYLAAQERR
jgi:hypothetical protein